MVMQARRERRACTSLAERVFRGVFNDLTNQLPSDQCWELFNQMLRASGELLPGWQIDEP